MHNKFIELDSPLMPSSLPAWKEALAALSRIQEEAPEGVNAGYALPDPGLFLSTLKEETRASYFSMWLKVRDVVIYQICASCLAIEPIGTKQWRNLLALQKTTMKDGTKEAQLRQNALKFLRDASAQAETDFDFEHLASVPAMWRGMEIPSDKLPLPGIAKEILWELYEANFQLELTLTDSVLCKSGQGREDRQVLIDGLCWPNGTILPDLESSGRGLNAKELLNRAPFLSGLHTIMSSWFGPRPPCLQKCFPKVSECGSEFAELEQAERELAMFYVQSFFKIFGRAAMTPHCL